MDRVQYESLIIQELVNISKNDELNVQPWYQRRSVWTRPQRAYLINTLHEQKPIPAIYIRHSIDIESGTSLREIVDGQQRVRTILEYENNGFPAFHPDFSKKVHFEDLTKSQKQQFLLTSLPIAYLLGATDSDVIDIFGRINSVSKSLNDQEKRNANYSGDFKQFCLRESSERIRFWKDYGIFSASEISRMSEVQFTSDLALNLIEGLSDFSQAKLTKAYLANDEAFLKANQIKKKLDRVFDFLLSINPSAIKETIFRRQPLFFSLFLVISDQSRLSKKRIEEAMFEIDARFQSSDVQLKKDEAFVAASSATVQRIRQRRIRDKYIRGFIE